MPETRPFTSSSGDILIEVEDAGGHTSKSYARALADSVADIAQALSQAFKDMPADVQAPEVEVTLALRALPGGGYLIAREAAAPGVTVRLKLAGGDSASEEPSSLVPR